MTNIVTLAGTATREPQARTTSGDKQIVTLTVVTSRPRRGEDGQMMRDSRGYAITQDEFHRVTCFNGLGKSVLRTSFKGQKVTIVGSIHYSQYEKNGTTHFGTEIIADHIEYQTYRTRTGDQPGDADTDEQAPD